MKFIQGHNRNQINLFPQSLEQSIDPDNEVRLIENFVKSLNISNMGFKTDYIENGRPAYDPAIFFNSLTPPGCKVKQECTKSKRGRLIERTEPSMPLIKNET